MWCKSCGKDVEPDAENALLNDIVSGWIHVLILPDGRCIAHTTEGYPVNLNSEDICGSLHRDEHETGGRALIGQFVELDETPGDVTEAAAGDEA
jgi:hypothetical protein